MNNQNGTSLIQALTVKEMNQVNGGCIPPTRPTFPPTKGPLKLPKWEDLVICH